MNKTLVQIISKQTMPNLLAAMAVKPEKIVHVCTPSMKKASAALTQAYRESWVKADVVEVPVGEKPLIPEMFAAISSALKGSENAVVNFTGGTKPMSIGAYGAANASRVPSFYVDTERGEFLDGATGSGLVEFFPNADLTIARINKQLTVNAIAKANGVERVTGGQKWGQYATLADLLLRDKELERISFEFAQKIILNEPKKSGWGEVKKYWQDWYSQAIDLPESICCAAVEAGLFKEEGGSFYAANCWSEKIAQLDLGASRYSQDVIYAAVNDAKWPFLFFNGNWWEIAVMRYYAESKKIRDLRWSVDAGSRCGGSTDMEEDILGVDGVNLLYVSCKRGGYKSKLSRTLEDVNSSALRLGGDFAHKVIAVFKDITGKDRKSIMNRCRELHLQLLTHNEVMSVPAL